MIVILFIICFLIFANNIMFGLYAVSICTALWLEWDVGVNIGLIDIFIFSSIPVFFSYSSTVSQNENATVKRLIAILIFINCITSFFNPQLGTASLSKILWDAYKTAYIPLLFFIFYNLVNSYQRLIKIIYLLLFSATVSSIFGIIQAIIQKPVTIAVGTYAQYLSYTEYILYHDILRSFGTLLAANHFGGFLIMPISLTFSCLLSPDAFVNKKMIIITFLLQFSALLLSLSRAALIGTIISFLIIIVLTGAYKRRRFLFLMFFLFTAIGIGESLGFNIIPQRIQSRVISIKKGTNDDAMTPRFARWEYFYKRSLEKPFTGWGYIADDNVLFHFDGIAASPHSTYLFIAVKHGYISLTITVIIILMMIVKAGINIIKIGNLKAKAINIGILSSLIGTFGFSGFYDAYLQNSQIDVMFWIISAIVFKYQSIYKYSEP